MPHFLSERAISALIVYGYVFPVLLALADRLWDLSNDLQDDIDDRRRWYKDARPGSWYIPKLTVGRVIWRLSHAFVPVVNIFIVVFSVAPSLLGWILDRAERIASIPLVPARPKPRDPEDPR